jgi:hypothetical protein
MLAFGIWHFKDLLDARASFDSDRKNEPVPRVPDSIPAPRTSFSQKSEAETPQ